MRSIIVIIDYFGKWPEWFPLYLESCRKNPTITWLFNTDCDTGSFNIENVKFRYISREEYVRQVSEKLGIRFAPQDNYKFCDLKPATGFLYEKDIEGYDFYGYGDIDVLYGDIRKFYTDEVLENNIISSHTWCISGHLALFRNRKWIREAFRRCPEWKSILEHPVVQRFDEGKFSSVFTYPNVASLPRMIWHDISDPFGIKYRRKIFCKEQYTTPLTPGKWRNGAEDHPEVWFWKNGRITNGSERDMEYIYLHFMNFKNGRFMDPKFGKNAPWANLKKLVHVDPEDIGKPLQIDRNGFRIFSPLI